MYVREHCTAGGDVSAEFHPLPSPKLRTLLSHPVVYTSRRAIPVSFFRNTGVSGKIILIRGKKLRYMVHTLA